MQPLEANSLRMEEIREPAPEEGDVLVESIALGVCGTDREMLKGTYGAPPPGHKRLVIGHESLGLVREAPAGSAVAAGDLVVPFVRLPDPVPCDCCAVGEWDRCRNDGFTEHGIRSRDGFGRERYRVPEHHLLRVDSSLGLNAVLMEPTSVVAKAWSEIDRLTRSVCNTPRRVLVTGAGPIGLLAAMLGRQRGLDVGVLDRGTSGVKEALAREIGATWHSPPAEQLPRDYDIVVECTGAASLVTTAPILTAPGGVVCLLGVAGRENPTTIAVGTLNDAFVLGNRIVFGSVNANRSHFELAHEALKAADARWLSRLITRRIPFDRFAQAFAKVEGDIKSVILFDGAERLLA